MEKISITPPTWAAAAHVYCAALEGGTAEGRTAARDEIMRLARQYDAACDYIRELEKATQDLVDLCVKCGFEWESLDTVINLLEEDR